MSRNDITGDSLTTKPASDSYRDNWERIFGKKKHDENNQVGTKQEQERENTETSRTGLPGSDDRRLDS